MEIEKNRTKEELEATKFEMSNKILQLENALDEAEDEKKRLNQLAASAKDRMEDAEKRQKEISDEFVHLQSSNTALNAANDKLVIMLTALTQFQLNFITVSKLLVMQLTHYLCTVNTTS
jgi:chromosome segregation ATPase